MDDEDEAGVGVDGGAVVIGAGAVGGTHFAERSAGAGHDVGDAEAVADLDEFAARDNDFAAGGKLIECEVDRGGVVIDNDGRFAEDLFQENGGVDVALAAAAGCEVVFEVHVAAGRGFFGKRGAAEVGMEYDAGGVDDTLEGGAV